ncbi:MAG TPA: PAS domain-containing protein [Steroidobacteraceae bacterium]
MSAAQKQTPADSDSATPSLTAAKLAALEARLADAEDILNDALQSSSSWIWESDDKHCFTRIVGPIEPLFGTPPEKLIGRPVEDFTLAQSDPEVQRHFETIQQQRPYHDVLTTINTRKGVRHIKASGKPRFDAGGKFLGYRGTTYDVTEQLETERKAKETYRRFAEAIEHIPASLMLCDSTDRIVLCNSATQKYFPTATHLLMSGTRYEDLLRAHAASGAVKDVGDNFEAWIEERMKHHRSGNSSIIRSYQDGRWGQIIERRTADGGIISIRTDITAMKQREAEQNKLAAKLIESEKHLALAQQVSAVGSFERNLKTGEVTWSEENSRIMGWDPGRPPPSRDDVLQLVHPEDREKYVAVMAASEQGLQPSPLTFRVRHADGSTRWIYHESTTVLDADGTPARRLGTYRDVTEEHAAQEEIRAMTDKLRASEEHLARAQRISRTGSDERNLLTGEGEWSDTTYEIFGVSRESFVPNYANFLSMVHPDDQHICLEVRSDIEAGKPHKPYEYRIIRPDGQVRTIYRETVVNCDEYGKPVSYTGTLCDVTELRAASAQIEQKAREIEAHAEELKRSNAELEQFAYVASHDLQEPLRMVASYCQMLQRRYKDKLDNDANEFIGFAVEGANRMQRLINDLLAYSRFGRKGAPPENLAMDELVKTALANLQGAIADAKAKIEVAELPTVFGERMQLAQMFQNLIGNAIKFRRDEIAPEIRISAAPEGAMWHFVVADNGIGIEKEYVDRVFLIFQRLHERNKYPGTGIGLAIVKKVIERHGGRIWIESTPNLGSQFHFTLPAARQMEQKDA